MLKSMTGFGRGSAENALGVVKVEIKSLNYKFFEVVTRLPSSLTIFEDKIREVIQKKVARGRLNLFLSYEISGKRKDEVYIDKKVAGQYYKKIKDLKKQLSIKGEVGIEQIISLPGVVAYRPQEDDAKRLWPLIHKALLVAAEDLTQSKSREGRRLRKSVKTIIKSLGSSVKKVEMRTPKVVADYKKRLLKNIKKLTGSKRILNRERTEEEAAIFARNCDITEEIHRITSHITGFKKTLSMRGELGRRLDFIAQEMHREANTIGAKANDFPIAKEVIKIKSQIEKIREQVQNVE